MRTSAARARSARTCRATTDMARFHHRQVPNVLTLDSGLFAVVGENLASMGHKVQSVNGGGVGGYQAMCVARSEWKGHVTDPKGGRIRYVPLTQRLTSALTEARSLRSKRVLCDRKGHSLTQKEVQVLMRSAARRASVRKGVHILRHIFCSHLAMKGAPARAIQELAGHQDLMATQRYMHLSPAALDAAIRLLVSGGVPADRAAHGEAPGAGSQNSPTY